jgi:hypothetical protein
MTVYRAAAMLSAAAVLGLTGVAVAAAPRDSYVRHRISFTQKGVFQEGNQEGLSVNFVTPMTWTAVKRTTTHQSFRVGTTHCQYSVTFTTRFAEDSDETPLQHVTAALSTPSSPYLLDQGTRNSGAAWRVTRLKPASARNRRVQLRAMRADHRSLGGGERAWQETIASASSRAADECHAGTYRNVLGPQIGDALATATGRAYSFAPKPR